MGIKKLRNLLMVTQLVRDGRSASKWFVLRNHVTNCCSIIFPFYKFIFIIYNISFFSA